MSLDYARFLHADFLLSKTLHMAERKGLCQPTKGDVTIISSLFSHNME